MIGSKHINPQAIQPYKMSFTSGGLFLDRGLDIFQAPIKREGFSITDRLQENRAIKGVYATYLNEGAK